MILIFEDPNYAKSVWCQSLVRGLVSELKLKRAAFRFVSSAQELSSQANEGDFVYIIGSGSGWITSSASAASTSMNPSQYLQAGAQNTTPAQSAASAAAAA